MSPPDTPIHPTGPLVWSFLISSESHKRSTPRTVFEADSGENFTAAWGKALPEGIICCKKIRKPVTSDLHTWDGIVLVLWHWQVRREAVRMKARLCWEPADSNLALALFLNMHVLCLFLLTHFIKIILYMSHFIVSWPFVLNLPLSLWFFGLFFGFFLGDLHQLFQEDHPNTHISFVLHAMSFYFLIQNYL